MPLKFKNDLLTDNLKKKTKTKKQSCLKYLRVYQGQAQEWVLGILAQFWWAPILVKDVMAATQ